VHILTPLDPRDTMTSGFRVHAYLARIAGQPRLRLAEGEISGVITPSVRTLADPRARREREISFATWPASKRVECVPLDDGQPLWGLTLELLDPLLRPLLAGRWHV
jgi:hypothetical protein